ncbi:hypothetical protein [Sapientia aquatica]|jgi:hypothetical protein|uniref:hypothetical protein n=1 Tax=Sapientia aquatica TaxID=1549640 RepID=UPI00140513CE|nr:hypothetical protein [Sapientia aquatica]
MRKNPRWRIVLTALVIISMLGFALTAFFGRATTTSPAPIPPKSEIPSKPH